jgi:hypothetical protein
MELLKTAKEMALMAALRAAITLPPLIGRELALSEAERRALLDRLEVALLGRAADGIASP